MKASVFLLSFALVVACGSRTEGFDTSKLPEDLRGDYATFAHRCSKCHTLARPLTSNISDDEQWVLYVNRMRRQPGSGISMQDQEHILRFLRFYAAELRRKDAEKRGLTVSPAAATTPPTQTSAPQIPPPIEQPSPPASDGGVQ